MRRRRNNHEKRFARERFNAKGVTVRNVLKDGKSGAKSVSQDCALNMDAQID
jgi:hypothetical protein